MKANRKAKVTVVTEQGWNVPDWCLKHHSEKGLEEVLNAFNHAGGNNFYFLDYFRKKFIVDSPSSLILCGHSKALADEKGFDFFQYILSDTEWIWLNRVNLEGYQFFFNYDKNRRKDLLLSYDLAVLTAKSKEFILHHHLVPYKLCKNGNVWLGLCNAWASDQKKANPTIIDRKTGEQYNFVDNKFVKSDTLSITERETMILNWMVQGLPDKEMSSLLESSSVANFKREKRILFDKLEACTSATAIHRAHLRGII